MASSPLCRPRTPPNNRAREIAASDEEDSDGSSTDNSLADLSVLLGGGGGGARPQPPVRAADHLLTTPQAKRRAATTGRHQLHRSPLAIIPRHRFDLKALAKDAQRDTALQASSQRAREPVRDLLSTPSGGGGGDGGGGGAATSASYGVLTGIVNGEMGAKDAHKVMRAVQRADPGHQELRYCFFRTAAAAAAADDDDGHPDGAGGALSSRPPPEAKKSPWSLLTEGNRRVREQNLISGVLFNVVGCQDGMPEAVFLWVLEEICTAQSAVTRTELCNLIALCPDQIQTLLTPDVMKSTWERIGAKDVCLERGPISVSKVGEDVYKGRNWASLLAILSLLKDISQDLPLETQKYALQLLLRMAMDRLIISNVDIGNQFEETFKNLIETIPPEEWNSFCHDTCALLQGNFASQCIRVNALLCLPTSSLRAHDLRRRLAATFLFQDASLARRAPEEVVTLQAVIDRLAQPDFQVGPRTEFAELRASVLILDMAVDDGSVLALPPADGGGGGGSSSSDAEEQFNQSVDELAARLHDIWRRTNDAGMKLARTEAKSVVEWVQKRVTHTVRTRRRRARSIFDLPGQERQKQQKRDLPRQQEFMKSFLRKKPPSPAPTGGQGPGTEVAPQPETESESEPEPIVLDSIVVRGR
ncbi:hypothetical protein V2A60_010144 [Cordyceps javanica]